MHLQSSKAVLENIFDLVYEEIQAGESSFDAEYMDKAREGFGAVVDRLKKKKSLKARWKWLYIQNQRQHLL